VAKCEAYLLNVYFSHAGILQNEDELKLDLSAGFYDIEAGSKGFKTQVRKGVAVTVGATVTRSTRARR